MRGLKALALAAVLALSSLPAVAQTNEVLVFAAASMKTALDDIAKQWQVETGKSVKVSYAASSALAKQIEQGAPADLFISADSDWMNYVAGKSLIKPATRVDMLGNRIVLVAAKDSKVSLKIAPNFDLAGALGSDRLAMANVESVPAGKYGKAALERLGVWGAVAKKVAQADDVRATLLLVSRGEAPLGIVYQTDAAADANVKIVDAFPTDSHPAIIYPAAVLASSKNADAEAFLAYLRSAKAKPLFEKQGFSVLQ
ncbi:MAG TPA: molybdate ABC transporter substrate-binding protein [Alphaproteobacteria bacterium]|nr:molybdate ABC transporter substrate-binding protein [Alphaproteobacteria bacterium]